MRRSPTDHGYERGGRRARGHIHRRNLDRLTRGRRGYRHGATMLGRRRIRGWHRERKNERDRMLRIRLVLHLAALSFLSFLVLGPLGAIDVIRVHLLMLLLLFLCEFLPVEPLLGGEGLPLLADGLGEVSLALLLGWAAINRCSSVFLSELAFFAASSAEEDECVLGTFDVVIVALFRSALDVAAHRGLATLVGRGS